MHACFSIGIVCVGAQAVNIRLWTQIQLTLCDAHISGASLFRVPFWADIYLELKLILDVRCRDSRYKVTNDFQSNGRWYLGRQSLTWCNLQSRRNFGHASYKLRVQLKQNIILMFSLPSPLLHHSFARYDLMTYIHPHLGLGPLPFLLD